MLNPVYFELCDLNPLGHISKKISFFIFAGSEEAEVERDQNESEANGVEQAEAGQDFEAEHDEGESNVYRTANQRTLGA